MASTGYVPESVAFTGRLSTGMGSQFYHSVLVLVPLDTFTSTAIVKR